MNEGKEWTEWIEPEIDTRFSTKFWKTLSSVAKIKTRVDKRYTLPPFEY